MNTYSIFEYLLELTQASSKEILNIYNNGNKETSLIFPIKRDGSIRISEQELRFTLINMHNKFKRPGFSYSVETPTKGKYSFNGKGERSASTDLSFYYKGKQILNVEFKAHNPNKKAIKKDIEKLIKESCKGAWIHILENENKRTVQNLFEKFKKELVNYPNPKHPISFHILILKTNMLLSRKGKDGDINKTSLSGIFNIEYCNWKNLEPGRYQFRNRKLIDEYSLNNDEDWQIDKYDINSI